MSLSDQVVMATSIETLIELLKNLPDYGRVSYVVTAKGDEVKTAFDIVDASALLVSNTLDGKINPDYPQELQPRDRTRASSLLQVNQISKDLRPAQLTDSGLSSHGAPIIGEDNAVESGNGRTMGIIKAYQDGNADRYREYLIEHATEFGIRPEKVESMTAPVLVRRRLTKVDRVQFAKDSNISDLQEMAASEKAFVDADSITPAMMALFNPSESGDLLSRSNDAFIRGFMTQVGATQAAGLVTEDGRPTRQLVDRIQNAIFAKAYKDARLVRIIGDRSWRVGQYYDCAGDIVRIKSLDFDSQRADVEIIFTFKGTKSGNWDVKTLDKQVDVTPDEDAVMQKISGGVSIAGINDIISCDDFYRFQQRGMIKITDSYGVQTTESGYSIDFVGTYTDPLKHAVYPDRRDGALKSSIAKWVLGMMSEGNNRQIRSAETFLVELFGSNYGDVIASYGDTLSPEAIQEKIADAIARMPEKTSQGATRNGDSELEVTNAIFGTNEFRGSDYEITTAQFGTIGIYSNKAEIKQAMDAASARIAAEREANLNHAVAALTQSWVTAIREAATTGKITPAIADVVNDGSKFMDAYQMDAVKLPSAYGQLSYRMTYNLVSMFSDLAILGLVDLNEVTPELLSMRKNHVEILQRINTVLAGRTDEEKQADADRINLALGNITEEEIAARNEKQEELSSIQGDATSIAQSLGLNYRVSTADLKMMYAPKFAAGEVFGLQEASGMKGVLFRAKDAIKAKFGARWLPAKAKNSDFPGNWWIIETKHNVADVLAVIQQYA
ncbi:hypothetical protein MZV21_25035 [Escherichia coli]|uniref:hypothetical protein n=1 Tax=Escherichia coli TaxID=562 RepID=UPI003458ACA0